MKSTRVAVTNQELNSFATDMLVFCAIQNDTDGPEYDSSLKSLMLPLVVTKDFQGKSGEVALLYKSAQDERYLFAAKRILVIGIGKPGECKNPHMAREAFRIAGGTISSQCARLKTENIAICLAGGMGLKVMDVAECLTEGILLGDYRFAKYKKADPEEDIFPGIEQLTFLAATQTEAIGRHLGKGENAARAVCEARDMANEPGNGWTPDHFADYAGNVAERCALSCQVLGKSDLVELQMGGLLAVNQGSALEPKMVVLEYNPGKKKNGTILLVGKGLTFDSGGICLKPAENMQDMKYDMCGGAAVLAAMQAIATEKPAVRVVAVVPATDNMTGSAALKPGDIIRHYNGLTSEVINTDAEGRLILADALAYGIEQYLPDCVIDLATLTGAVIIALGHHHSGILGTNDRLIEHLLAAGEKSGEPLWRLPLGKEYSKQIESKLADMKNTGGRPGGTITAAAYLQKFVGDVPWAHLDIAGTAWDFTEKSYIPKGPSGIGVRTLLEFVRNWKKGCLA
jgi:leucyl aminopeptidase